MKSKNKSLWFIWFFFFLSALCQKNIDLSVFSLETCMICVILEAYNDVYLLVVVHATIILKMPILT